MMQATRRCLVEVSRPLVRFRPAAVVAVQQHAAIHQSTNKGALPKQKLTKPKSSKPRFLLPQGTTLPHTIEVKGLHLRIENITAERMEEAWNLVNNAIGLGEGYSRDELEPFDVFCINSQKMNNYFEIIHEEDNKLLAVIILTNSPLARSEKSVHFGGVIAVNPEYRSQGLGSSVVYQTYVDLGRTILGHFGVAQGRTVVGKSINAIIGTGSTFHGMIPECSFLEGKGRIMDLAITSIDPRHISKGLRKAPVPALHPLIVSELVPERLQSHSPPLRTLPDLPVNDHTLRVEHASPADVWRVEELIRQAAERGDGFGIDEFTKEGHFNRKMMFESHVVVAKTADDVIVAASVFGPSKLCRAYNPGQMGGYVLVNPEFRRKGVGRAFAMHLMSIAKEVGAKGILTEAYTTDQAAQQFLNNLEFVVTGTLPHAGYLVNKGYTHTYMYWRSLD